MQRSTRQHLGDCVRVCWYGGKWNMQKKKKWKKWNTGISWPARIHFKELLTWFIWVKYADVSNQDELTFRNLRKETGAWRDLKLYRFNKYDSLGEIQPHSWQSWRLYTCTIYSVVDFLVYSIQPCVRYRLRNIPVLCFCRSFMIGDPVNRVLIIVGSTWRQSN